MDGRDLSPVRFASGRLEILDQTRLPHEEVWTPLDDAGAVVEAISSMRVRGAPLIGVVGAYGAAMFPEAGRAIGGARPTAINLRRAVERVLAAQDPMAEARAIHREEIEACDAMAKLGAELLPDRARVLTHCNTGSLATGGCGTAFGVLRSDRVAHVWATETRPLLQGARLTTWELQRAGIPFTLLTDGAAGARFSAGDVDVVVVGADRIAANGDTANKVGTYVLAVLAHHHGVPFYVVAPTSTIDPDAPSGEAIPIEERDASEVRGSWAPPDAQVANPAFDVTPAHLISAIVTEVALHRAPYRFG